MLGRGRSGLSYASGMATLALFVALGGGAYAAVTLPKNSVDKRQLKKGAVTSKKVADHSLLTKDFKAGQVPAGPRGLRGLTGPAGLRGSVGGTGRTGKTGNPGPGTKTYDGQFNIPSSLTFAIVPIGNGLQLSLFCDNFGTEISVERTSNSLGVYGFGTASDGSTIKMAT